MAARKTQQRRGGKKNAGQFTASPTSWGAMCLSVFALAAGSAIVSDGPGAFGAGGVNASGPSHAHSASHRWAGPKSPCGAGNDCAVPVGTDPVSVTVNGKTLRVKCAKALHAWDMGTRWGGYSCQLPANDGFLKHGGFRYMKNGKGKVN